MCEESSDFFGGLDVKRGHNNSIVCIAITTTSVCGGKVSIVMILVVRIYLMVVQL